MAKKNSDFMLIMMIFIGAIISIVLLGSIADQVAAQTTNLQITNSTVAAPAVNATTALTGRDLLSTIEVYNATDASDAATGVTLTEGLGTNGAKTVLITTADTGAAYAGENVNVSYTYRPDGHVGNSSNVSITLLITLFAALASLVFTVSMVWLLFKGSTIM